MVVKLKKELENKHGKKWAAGTFLEVTGELGLQLVGEGFADKSELPARSLPRIDPKIMAQMERVQRKRIEQEVSKAHLENLKLEKPGS